MSRWAVGDGGAGTVLALSLVSVVFLATGAVVAVGSAAVVRHRAAAAADAAALAAAVEADAGALTACALARRAASASDARLVSCRVVGAVAQVRVEVKPPSWLRWAGAAALNARAGPAETYQDSRTNREKAARPARPT